MSEALLTLQRSLLFFLHRLQVYNDECVYSFATPFSPGGLYVSLSNWQVRVSN